MAIISKQIGTSAEDALAVADEDILKSLLWGSHYQGRGAIFG
jgi:hypothetical protein